MYSSYFEQLMYKVISILQALLNLHPLFFFTLPDLFCSLFSLFFCSHCSILFQHRDVEQVFKELFLYLFRANFQLWPRVFWLSILVLIEKILFCWNFKYQRCCNCFASLMERWEKSCFKQKIKSSAVVLDAHITQILSNFWSFIVLLNKKMLKQLKKELMFLFIYCEFVHFRANDS